LATLTLAQSNLATPTRWQTSSNLSRRTAFGLIERVELEINCDKRGNGRFYCRNQDLEGARYIAATLRKNFSGVKSIMVTTVAGSFPLEYGRPEARYLRRQIGSKGARGIFGIATVLEIFLLIATLENMYFNAKSARNMSSLMDAFLSRKPEAGDKVHLCNDRHFLV
jgi:hypothetical protein